MASENDETDHRPVRRMLRALIKAPAAWALVWPMVLLVGSYSAYTRWYQPKIAQRHSQVDPRLITISQPHEFIRGDLVAEVYRDTTLSDLSPLDRNATAKLASAFASHAWVRHVQHVRKLPKGAFEVDLQYRRPVAVFHVTGDQRWLKHIEAYLTQLGFCIDGGIDRIYFPLDGEGVLLPAGHMTLEDTQKLIHIEVSEVFPQGNQGNPFGNRQVESAALLAELLTAVSDRIRIAKITVNGDPRMNLIPQLELVTGDNTHLHWGSPPGMEQPNERGAREKLADLIAGNYVPDGDLRVARQLPQPIH